MQILKQYKLLSVCFQLEDVIKTAASKIMMHLPSVYLYKTYLFSKGDQKIVAEKKYFYSNVFCVFFLSS